MKTALRRAVLAVTVAAVFAVAPAASAQKTFAFTIDAVRLAADRHTVVVSGTYTCGPFNIDVPGGGGTVDLTVNQGRVRGIGYVPIGRCDDTAQPFQAEATSVDQRRFQGGRATVLASGLAAGERDGELITQRTALEQRVTITRR